MVHKVQKVESKGCVEMWALIRETVSLASLGWGIQNQRTMTSPTVFHFLAVYLDLP